MFKSILKRVSKSLGGLGILGLGAAVNYVPGVGQMISPYIMGIGASMLAVGVGHKVAKGVQGKPIFNKEKVMFKKEKKEVTR